MSRRGFALLTVLWLIVALTAVAGTSLVLARVGAETSRNRILLMRAGWAREACAEILLARYADRGAVAALDSTSLGGSVWCRAAVEDAGTRLDLNLASAEALRSLLGSDSLADALIDWRDADELPRSRGAEAEWYQTHGRHTPRNGPLADVAELRLIRGFDSAMVARLTGLATTRGGGQVDLNTAPPEVVATLPGLDPAAAAVILARRLAGRPLGSTEELLSLLPAPSRDALLGRYQGFASQAAYSPGRIVVLVEGSAGRPPLASAVRLTVAPVPGRLAVIRREVQ